MTSSRDAPRAVILAAGLGSRLRPLTLETPKPLVAVHGTPILHNALRNLATVGVREATIVVGFRQEIIQRSCGEAYAGVRIKYVPSSAFDRTGSAYSLWLARDTLMEGDTLLLEGDVFFDAALLQRVLKLRGDVAAVDTFDHTMSGSAAVLTSDGSVGELRMNQTAATAATEPLYKTVNLYRFTADSLRRVIVPALDGLIGAGNCKWYVEQFLAQLLSGQRLQLRAALCQGVRWFEIDSETDLRLAERIFAPAIRSGAAAVTVDAAQAQSI